MRSRRKDVVTVAVLCLAVLSGCTSDHAPKASDVVVPPQAEHVDIPNAYGILHRLGFRVTLADAVKLAPFDMPTSRLSPAAGSRVPRGTTITLTPVYGPVGSPAVAKSHPHHRVPNFIHQPLDNATHWADSHDLWWAIPNLPPLVASDAPQLFDAYRIVGQTPKVGTVLGQGVLHGHAYKPTPLTLTVVLSGAG